MRTIKVFGLPSHHSTERTSGVDFARIIQPMKFLDGYKDDDCQFKVDILDPESKVTALDIGKEYDIIFLNYIANPWGFAEIGAMARHYGRKIVFDIDDALWNIMPDNIAHEVYKKGSEGIKNLTAICNEVDLITTTNQYLKNVIMKNTIKSREKVKVLPNFIDLDGLYTHRSPFKDTSDIRILHFGSTTHFIDLQNQEFEKGIDMIMKEYPNVTFKTVGSFIPKYRHQWGNRYEQGYGHQDVIKWVTEKMPDFMDESDIMVVPLEENIYTRCKSSIKWLEMSSAMKSGVWQDIRQYQEVIDHGRNGFLASSAQQWYESIKKLIDDKKLRESMATESFYDVKQDWQMKNHISDYANVFKEVLNIT